MPLCNDSVVVRSALLAILSLPASAFGGEIYGTVDVQAGHYVAKPQTMARRVSLPPPEARPPAGLIIVLEGDPLAQEKFDKPTKPLRLEVGAYGFESRVLYGQVGVPFEVENKLERPLKLRADGLAFEAVPAGGKINQVLGKTGRFVVSDESEPGHQVVLIVAPSVYVVELDNTGEFLFDDLPPGEYKVRLLGYDSLAAGPDELGVQSAKVEQTGRTTVRLALPPAAENNAAKRGDK